MTFNFKFELIIQEVSIDISFHCQLQITWKSSQMISLSQQKPFLNKGKALFQESLINQVSLKLNQNDQKFSEKKTLVQIQLLTSKGIKQAGYIILDLAQFINEKTPEIFQMQSLQKCPDKNAKIQFTIKCVYLEQGDSLNSSQYSINEQSNVSPEFSIKNSLNNSITQESNNSYKHFLRNNSNTSLATKTKRIDNENLSKNLSHHTIDQNGSIKSKQLHLQISQQKIEIFNLQQNLKQNEQLIQNQLTQNQCLCEQIQKLQIQLDTQQKSYQNEMSQLNLQIQEQNLQIKDIQEKMQNITSQKQSLQDINKDLLNQSKNFKDIMEQEFNQISELNIIINEKQQQAEISKDQNIILEQKFQELQIQNQINLQAFQKLKNEQYNQINDLNIIHQKNLKELQNNIDILQEKNTQYEKINQQQLDDIMEIQNMQLAKFQTADTEIKSFQKQLQTSQQKIQKLKEELIKNEDENKDSISFKKKQLVKVEELQNIIITFQMDKQLFDKTCQNNQKIQQYQSKRIQILQKQYEEAKQEIDKNENRFLDFSNEIQIYKNDIQELNKNIKNLQQQKEQIHNAILRSGQYSLIDELVLQ